MPINERTSLLGYQNHKIILRLWLEKVTRTQELNFLRYERMGTHQQIPRRRGNEGYHLMMRDSKLGGLRKRKENGLETAWGIRKQPPPPTPSLVPEVRAMGEKTIIVSESSRGRNVLRAGNSAQIPVRPKSWREPLEKSKDLGLLLVTGFRENSKWDSGVEVGRDEVRGKKDIGNYIGSGLLVVTGDLEDQSLGAHLLVSCQQLGERGFHICREAT